MAPEHQNPYYETLRGDEEELPLVVIKEQPISQDAAPKHQANPPAPTTKPIRTTVAKAIPTLPKDLFRKGIEKWLPRPNDPLADRKILPDAVFPDISQLLVSYGKLEWSYRPRTFSILWMLGLAEEKIDIFIADGRTDHYLPYNEGNLPDIIKGAKLRSRFLKLQNVVRCRREDDIAQLEAGGRHVYLRGDVGAYFHSMKPLGCGKFAKVDQVYSCLTTKKYARKQIHRGQSVLEDKTQLAAFEKELISLKKLSHRHVVQLVGSYTHPSHLGLIMSPVADRDLHEYLDSNVVDHVHRKRTLRGFFGCLVTALAYIHSKNVRHKDVKPSNILIKDDQILLADFGTSKCSLEGHMTTNGDAKEGTPRYWAPEVMDGAV